MEVQKILALSLFALITCLLFHRLLFFIFLLPVNTVCWFNEKFRKFSFKKVFKDYLIVRLDNKTGKRTKVRTVSFLYKRYARLWCLILNGKSKEHYEHWFYYYTR
jgi:hypothetical protein